jgi:SPP1 family predicted phage head-tail adaptor
MRAGSLRHLGTLQDRSTTKDAYGGQPQTWIDVETNVAFSINALGGDEVATGGGVRGQSRYQIVMRYRDGVGHTMRLVEGSRVYNFVQVSDVEERHRELRITAVEGVVP